ETDLYLWIAEHRAALEAKLGLEIEAEAVVADLTAHFSPKPQRIVARVSERIRDAMTPDELESGPPPGQWRRERLAARRTNHMFADVLVAINGKEIGWCALEHALFIARHEEARVHGFHVTPAPVPSANQAIRAMQTEFDRRCKEAGVAGKFVVESGGVSRRVYQRARWTDMVILSLSHPPGPQPIARLGSGLSALIRRCP
ncbi:MAG: universal stress protein, partial [Bradyrhizobium sp.]|nr:universal stress protein [Bradyrhizobium sp.]